MNTPYSFKVRSLILVVALSAGLGFASLAFSQHHASYLVDPNGG